jgi:transcriptional regulator with XRE-family HTH domain
MPRPNKPREVFAEDHVATRIARERASRGWSLEKLADAMTEAGCSIAPSAIYKIEQGEPRRRITVDELVALSKVFAIPMNLLVADPDDDIDAAIADRLEKWSFVVRGRAKYLRDSHEREAELVDELRLMVKTPKGEKALVKWLAANVAGDEVAGVREWIADYVATGREPSRRGEIVVDEATGAAVWVEEA